MPVNGFVAPVGFVAPTLFLKNVERLGRRAAGVLISNDTRRMGTHMEAADAGLESLRRWVPARLRRARAPVALAGSRRGELSPLARSCPCSPRAPRSAVGRHVRSAEDMNMLPTAAFFGEKIVCLPGAKDSGAPAPRPRPSALTHASNPHPAPGALRCALTQAVLCGADVYKLAHIYYKQRHFKRALQVPVCVGWWPRARLLGPFPHGTALPRRNYCELACRQEAA